MSHSLDLVQSVSPKIQVLGGKYMVDGATATVSAGGGFTNPFAFYFLGRGGVLGDVDADVVASAFGFFGASMVRTMWNLGVDVMAPRQAARLFAGACHDWGREHLAGLDGLDRLADLGEKVIEAVDPTGFTLFAGWRAEPLPDDTAARAAQVLHVLREHRGSAHLVAVVSTGLKPIEAMVVDRGHERAKFFGWEDPLPDPEAHRPLRLEAEALTDRLVEPGYRALDPDECAEFDSLVASAYAAVMP